MIKIYDKHVKGAEYKHPQSKCATTLKMTAYVDDIHDDNIHNSNQTSQKIKQEIERNTTIWEKNYL
jgi:hypothetical protein